MLFGEQFRDAGLFDDRIVLAGSGLSARYLLGADGAKSRVARSFGLGVNKKFLLGVEREYEEAPAVDEDSSIVLSIINSRRVTSAGLHRALIKPGWSRIGC